MEDWVKKSHKLPSLKKNSFLAIDFQSLGTVEGYLERLEEKFEGDLLLGPEQPGALNMISILSRMWLLSAYELIRVLAQDVGDKRFAKIHSQLKKIRIPLAKYERANRNVHQVAYPAQETRTHHFGWALEDGTFLTRRGLAQGILDSVE